MVGLWILLSVIISLLLSKILKLFFFKNTSEALLAGGGMPSSHCASATALTSMIFFTEGLTSLFVLSFSFAAVVLVDAVRVRRAVGVNADALKELAPKKVEDDIMVEHGHTIKEAVYGCVLGFVVATILFILFVA
ncbi:MAG: divergent PAP2 family protein [Nanoarchaeota archaeon]|nr:divergent PAP2 family protein [Nanoarchaeota archaeon]